MKRKSCPYNHKTCIAEDCLSFIKHSSTETCKHKDKCWNEEEARLLADPFINSNGCTKAHARNNLIIHLCPQCSRVTAGKCTLLDKNLFFYLEEETEPNNEDEGQEEYDRATLFYGTGELP